jgi:hypothetical protein
MSFREYLITRRNAIIVLMCVNCFALAVNTLDIKGKFNDDRCPDYVTHYFLSSGSSSNEKLTQQNFWPFVKYFEFSESSYYCQFGPKEAFKGIFRYYDYSEFFVYSILILLAFYIKWESSKKGK